MAKFKIGDRVKCVCVVDKNIILLNKIGTIIEIDCGLIGVEFDEWIHGHGCNHKGKIGYCWWCEESDLVKLVCSDKIVITTDSKTTTAKMYDGKEVVKTAIAKCSPEDEFDFETGAKIAFDRLTEFFVEKSFDWNAFKNDEFFVQVTADNFDKFIEEAEKHGCRFAYHERVNPFEDEEFAKVLRFSAITYRTDRKQLAPDKSVFITYRDDMFKFSLCIIDNKPVYIW